MSCEIRVTACIQEINKIRKCLFPTDDQRGTDSWLQSCKISACPTGDLFVIANERKLVVLTPKWDPQSSLNLFQVSYSGPIHDYDKVKAVLCLPVVGQNGNTSLGPEWTCIVIGFDSGHVRFYSENCELLFEEQFHAENITTIKCRSQHNPRPDLSPYLHPEEIYVQYQSNVCVLNGIQLMQTLRSCRNQPKNQDIPSLVPKKWGFQDQSVINDSVVVGLNLSNTFDHLLTASTCGGFHSKYRAVPPNNTLVVAAGSKPFLGYHYALEGGGQPVLSDVAKAVANKLKSTLPSWLTGNKFVQEKQVSVAVQPADAMGCRFGLCDLRRTSSEIILSPDHKLAAVCDSLGRILLIDTFKGIVLRMFKGYRDAQCAFIQVADERKSKHRLGNKVAHFLVIYSPKKGTLEIFSVQQGTRISIFTASKHSRLLYINYGLVGFSTTSKSKFICQYTTLFIDNDGQVKEFSVPFHFALAEKNNKRARDIHLYKKFRHLIKSESVDNDRLLNEALNTCTELKTVEGKTQMVEMLLGNKHVPPEVSLCCVQYFVNELEGEESLNLKILCQNASLLLELFVFITNPVDIEAENGNESHNEFSLNIDVKEMKNLQKLLDLSIVNDNVKLPEVHVKFTDGSKFSPSEFISVFDCSKPDIVSLKPNLDDDLKFKASEIIFKPYISGKMKNISELQTKLTNLKISTKNLFDLLVNYWVNRSLHINLNLEKEIQKLADVIYAFVKISKEDVNPEYGDISKFWCQIRDVLANSARPFPALMAAILCKNVAHKFEMEVQLAESGTSLDDMDMEVLSQENVAWSLLIGKLEDISLLNIIMSTKPPAVENSLPKLKPEEVHISLKYVLQKGKGSVSELVAQWLTSVGVDPQYILSNEEQDRNNESDKEITEVNAGNPVAEVKLSQHLSLLRRQFPYSVEANCILTNMSWEYATAWQKDMQNLNFLQAAISCLNCVTNIHMKQGLYQLLWNTHLKIVSESACKLINKVGKLPKERLCRQDTGLTDYQMSVFLSLSTEFLDSFMETVKDTDNIPKPVLNYENIWDNGGKPLVELAVQQKIVNFELLHLHYQLSLILLMITTFSIKHTKPINNLFEASVVNLFFTDLQKKVQISCNRSDIRLNFSRTQFLFKIISATLETITVNESGKIYFTDHVNWMAKCINLGKLWNLDVDELRRYQIVQLYSNGYDSIAQELVPAVNEAKELGKCLLNVAAKRLSQFLVSSPQLSENIGALSTVLTNYMETLTEEWCAPSALKDITLLATHTIHCLTEEDSEYKLASLLLESCKTLEDLQS
ncbi:rab3 GTPase-activating protein non-catalytic subunit [Diabrotica virgifera virgifera]|uniref:Rab3 GTPase-activating protein non-catalytic subunit n=1 Tax=Diabrotica virgifera virgifera TaxID=50390 RepID=A0ABM5IP62_DIAVI|nr:rab3 GTPase-activating protein non-catalytic subunit [Diabrotica virgifera virgifera]